MKQTTAGDDRELRRVERAIDALAAHANGDQTQLRGLLIGLQAELMLQHEPSPPARAATAVRAAA